MSELVTQFPNVSFAGRLATLGAAARRTALWPARVMEARRTLAELAAMSQHELRDIGLSRQDLVDFTARPLDEDPAPHLVRARAARARLSLARGGKA